MRRQNECEKAQKDPEKPGVPLHPQNLDSPNPEFSTMPPDNLHTFDPPLADSHSDPPCINPPYNFLPIPSNRPIGKVFVNPVAIVCQKVTAGDTSDLRVGLIASPRILVSSQRAAAPGLEPEQHVALLNAVIVTVNPAGRTVKF